MMDPDHQSLNPDPELESPDIPKRVEIRLRSRIQGQNRNTSTSQQVHLWIRAKGRIPILFSERLSLPPTFQRFRLRGHTLGAV